MKDLMHYLLGLEVWQSLEKIFLNQRKYAVEIMKRFDMLEYKSMNTPMETKLKLLVDTSSELVDATLYRKNYKCSDIYEEYQANYMFFLMLDLVEPRRVHLDDAKYVMRYLKGMLDFGLYYTRDRDFRMSGYTDSDSDGSVFDRKRTSGCCLSLGPAMTSWQSRKQPSISPNIAKAKYIVACSAICEAIWLRMLLTDLFDLEMEATMILCDK
jgi:hypothetical protein